MTPQPAPARQPYQLRALDIQLDGSVHDRLLHDINEPAELELRSLIASGDYFELLASKLDQIARTLPSNSNEEKELQRLIRQLIEAQRHYTIVPNKGYGAYS